ncbi:MAG TPA: lipid-binding SYLF domain-containing protein [Desulfuromonadales bacterium]|nr:lipid-binding SYLF domain-containing protein [Desulfuromonadales bacterium]
MKRWLRILLPAAVALAILCPTLSFAASKQQEKLNASISVLNQVMAIPEKGIPPDLLANAYGIAIIPNVIKVGFILGGRYGTGVLVIRDGDNHWGNPSFITLTGGSLGWQIGAQSTDVILVFKTRRSVEGIIKGKFTLGADAAVAAGPVGRRVEGATDVKLKAEIYSYSRSRGLFAGVSLEGSAIQIDKDANASFYGRSGISAGDILEGPPLPRPGVTHLKQMLAAYAKPPTH